MFNNEQLTLFEVMMKVHAKKCLLPPVHRVFDWNADQIIKFFDRVMREQAIGSFDFGRVNKERVKEFQYFEFLLEHHQPNERRHYIEANVCRSDEIIVVLDGQQRLNALYIGIMGSLADETCSGKRLYLNLLGQQLYREDNFEFKFLTDDEARNNDENHHWFKVENILAMVSLNGILDYLANNIENVEPESEKMEWANINLSTLYGNLYLHTQINWSCFSNLPNGQAQIELFAPGA